MGGEKLNRFFICCAVIIISFLVLPDSYADENNTISSPPRIPAGEEELVFSDPEAAIILGESAPGVASPAGPSFSVVLRMVLVLALAAAAIYGVVFFLRRAARPQESRNPHLKILTSAHLGSNRFVYVVSVGSQAWLLGAGEGGVSLISELTDQETVDAMLLENSVKNAETAGNFRALLRRIGGGFVPGKPGPAGGEGASVRDTLRKNRERLKGL